MFLGKTPAFTLSDVKETTTTKICVGYKQTSTAQAELGKQRKDLTINGSVCI